MTEHVAKFCRQTVRTRLVAFLTLLTSVLVLVPAANSSVIRMPGPLRIDPDDGGLVLEFATASPDSGFLKLSLGLDDEYDIPHGSADKYVLFFEPFSDIGIARVVPGQPIGPGTSFDYSFAELYNGYYIDEDPRDPPDDPGPNFDPPPRYESDGLLGDPNQSAVLGVNFRVLDYETDTLLDHYGYVRLRIYEPPRENLRQPPYVVIKDYGWETRPGIPVQAPIPEPATFGMLGLGMLLGVACRKGFLARHAAA